MPKHLAEPETDDRQARLDRLAGNVRRALQEYLEADRGTDGTYAVVEWAACVEYSNPAIERGRKAARMVVCETDRISQSTIEGLGLYMSGMSR